MESMLRNLRFVIIFVLLALSSEGSAPAQTTIYSDFPYPIGYWSFDRCDGDVVRDYAIGNGENSWPRHDGIKITPEHVQCVPFSRFGNAGYFDGEGDVEIQNSPGMNFQTLTVSAWVFPQEYVTPWDAHGVVTKWAVPHDSWQLFLEQGNWFFMIEIDGYWTWATAPAQLNTWTHLVGSYDGKFVRLYVNGALTQATEACPSSFCGYPDASETPIRIGSWALESLDNLKGYIDEVKLYNFALNDSQIKALATKPGSLPARGVHLYPSGWACVQGIDGHCVDPFRGDFIKDLGRIHSIGNIQAIKTFIYSFYKQDYPDIWLKAQDQKLRYLASAVGNHVVWIVRVTPEAKDLEDCPQLGPPIEPLPPGTTPTDFYGCGYNFALHLQVAFKTLGSGDSENSGLKLDNVYLEVGNEPNLNKNNIFFICKNQQLTMDNYNNFFHGFYRGLRDLRYLFPLIYAGLSPCAEGTTEKCYTPESWYADDRENGVRKHIQEWAAKVGAHVYWRSPSNDPNDKYSSMSKDPNGGAFYLKIEDYLKKPSMNPIDRKGIWVTEFNFNPDRGYSKEVQADQFCTWWIYAARNAQAGHWNEQSALFVTQTESKNGDWQYWIDDSQLETIRDCGRNMPSQQ